MKSSLALLCAAGLTAALVGGCAYRSIVIAEPHKSLPQATTPSQSAPSQDDGTGPIILNSFDANPTNVAAKSDKITFTVNAYNSNRTPMEYSWTATKGTLSGTRGQTVFWAPQKADGSIDGGLATVQVLITDGNGATKQAAVNIHINADGSAFKQL
ncbi:MAG: hypothetical protein FJZ01_11610 [Candidatus Sericytochromatia bacterium]|nr:hypothetical protein [Candidatus Tanganyikabacteria bacterium]